MYTAGMVGWRKAVIDMGLYLGLGCLALGCAGNSAQVREAKTEPGGPSPAEAQLNESGLDPKMEPLELVSSVWAPFVDEEGRPRIATDLVTRALNRAGIPTNPVLVPNGSVETALEKGLVDGTEALWETPGRSTYLEFSIPYLENRLVLLERASAADPAQSLSELEGKTLGIVRGYAYGPEITEAPAPALVEGPSDEANLRALLRGELDAILVDELLVYYLFTYDGPRARELLQSSRKAVAHHSLHFAVRKSHPQAKAIIAAFNAQLQMMIRDGSYHELLHVGWLVADHDGDGQDDYLLSGEFAGTAPPQAPYQVDQRHPVAMGRQVGGPRFVIEGKLYESWEDVPAQYKRSSPANEDLGTFRPGVSLVLMDF